jgi:uncharacterized protein (TIGR02217 family)
MPAMSSFHDVRFPTDLSLGATGGPVRRTEVITLASGKEQRNSRWANSRRRYNLGYGIKTVNDLHRVLEFFEERRGRLFGFRFRDPMDCKSCAPGDVPTAGDMLLGTGDGSTASFALFKHYGLQETGYMRTIQKPVEDSLLVAVDNVPTPPSDFTFNSETHALVFNANAIPASGSTITAGFEFDVAVRFDADEIIVNLSHFEAGDIPSIPIMEVVL